MNGHLANKRETWIAAALLALLVGLSVPMMLSMPLTADPSLYDLQAQTVLGGGVLYRDIVEPNLPGIVWAHIAIRSLFGWSEFALKAIDLVIVGMIATLLACWYRSSKAESLWIALFGLWFYFSTSEWCHCQRDTWMFLPALVGLYLRRKQIQRIADNQSSHSQLMKWSVLEGVVWAIGFWIKPFIAIPALAAMIVGWISVAGGRRHLTDFFGVLSGGLIIGAIGTTWLVASGTWPHFWEMAIEWNPTYFEVGRERWTWDRLFRQQLRFYPFSIAHLIAIPYACLGLIDLFRKGSSFTLSQRILSAVYLGWLFQTFFFQHLFDYIHVPELLLAITLSVPLIRSWANSIADRVQQDLSKRTPSTETSQSFGMLAGCGAMVALAMIALVTSTATRWDRVQYWSTCLQEGASARVKTGLQHFPLPHWEELEPALEFLRNQNLKDGELTVHNVYLVHAYRELQLRPSSRFVYLDVLTRVFRDHQKEIVESLDRSGHRFILSSLLENGMTLEASREISEGAPHGLPPQFPEEHQGEFPYQHPVVYRSGQYVIHRVEGTAAPLNPAFSPLAMTSDR